MEKIYKWRVEAILECIRHGLDACSGEQDLENLIKIVDGYLDFLGHIADE